jgi:hypothetical protein
MSGEQRPKSWCVAADNRVHSRFECGYRRVSARQFLHMPNKLRPAFESVFPSYEKLSACERTLGRVFGHLRQLALALLCAFRLTVALALPERTPLIPQERALRILELRESF